MAGFSDSVSVTVQRAAQNVVGSQAATAAVNNPAPAFAQNTPLPIAGQPSQPTPQPSSGGGSQPRSYEVQTGINGPATVTQVGGPPNTQGIPMAPSVSSSPQQTQAPINLPTPNVPQLTLPSQVLVNLPQQMGGTQYVSTIPGSGIRENPVVAAARESAIRQEIQGQLPAGASDVKIESIGEGIGISYNIQPPSPPQAPKGGKNYEVEFTEQIGVGESSSVRTRSGNPIIASIQDRFEKVQNDFMQTPVVKVTQTIGSEYSSFLKDVSSGKINTEPTLIQIIPGISGIRGSDINNAIKSGNVISAGKEFVKQKSLETAVGAESFGLGFTGAFTSIPSTIQSFRTNPSQAAQGIVTGVAAIPIVASQGASGRGQVLGQLAAMEVGGRLTGGIIGKLPKEVENSPPENQNVPGRFGITPGPTKSDIGNILRRTPRVSEVSITKSTSATSTEGDVTNIIGNARGVVKQTGGGRSKVVINEVTSGTETTSGEKSLGNFESTISANRVVNRPANPAVGRGGPTSSLLPPRIFTLAPEKIVALRLNEDFYGVKAAGILKEEGGKPVGIVSKGLVKKVGENESVGIEEIKTGFFKNSKGESVSESALVAFKGQETYRYSGSGGRYFKRTKNVGGISSGLGQANVLKRLEPTLSGPSNQLSAPKGNQITSVSQKSGITSVGRNVLNQSAAREIARKVTKPLNERRVPQLTKRARANTSIYRIPRKTAQRAPNIRISRFPLQREEQSSIQSQEEVLGTSQYSALKLSSAESVVQGSRNSVKFGVSQTGISGSREAQKQSSQQAQEVGQQTKQELKQSTRTEFLRSRSVPVRTQIRPGRFELPLIKLQESRFSSKKNKIGPIKSEYGLNYEPSLTSRFVPRVGKAPKTVTGLEIRPVVGRVKRRK